MISAIKEFMFQRHFKRLHHRPVQPAEGQINRLNSITILCKSPFHPVLEVREAVQYFRARDIICQAYIFDPKATEPWSDGMIELIAKDEFQWFGIPKKNLLIKWLSYKSDLLIFLNPDHSARMRYLCAASNSRLKSTVDYGHRLDEFVDFSLQLNTLESKNVKELCRSIYEALENISSRTWTSDSSVPALH